MYARKKRIEAEQKLYNIQQGKVQKPEVYGSRKKPPMMKHHDLDDALFGDANDDLLVMNSDAVSAAEYLIKINPKSSIPACFVHQIYSVLPNHNTVTDRELQQAFTSGTWRRFHIIGALDDEHVLMKTSDYCNMIDHARQQSPPEVDGSIYDKFKDTVTHDEQFSQVSVTKKALMEACNFTEQNISQLVSSGLLIPHHIQMDVYWYSIHNQGSFMSSLSNGRLQILRILKRRNTKDIMEKLLKQKKLNKSSFSMEFLMHDLIGSGRVEK
ncbi:clathrin associated protein complex medium subunit [Mucor velutinosus]|uniref:Clathrin associated protein complex medium subunit n=1 Tax=Mucor velutinosus TaxID=708070 RepID=A0AAN7HQJ2_9FUNG|nr:clathrin associated protein complex medium subunit [Mucor velutinosus]